MRERVLFIGTQFSILYISMYSPAEASTDVCENIEHKKHEYREEIYAELRGRSGIEDVRAVEML
jgi:hypothetical protein